MKIAIPVNEQALDSAVAENFGRAANFLFLIQKLKLSAFLITPLL